MSLWFIKKVMVSAAIGVLSSFYSSSRFRNSSGYVFFTGSTIRSDAVLT